jgi:uncharacterized protein
MFINLSEIMSRNQSVENIDAQLELDQFTYYQEKVSIKDGISMIMSITDSNDQNVSINGTLKTLLQLNCDRCNAPLNYSLHVEFSKMINLGDAEDNDEANEANEELEGVVTGNLLDVNKFALNEIYLNFPMKVLCKDDCQGVCQKCGANLNEKSCACEKSDIDPRWLGLKNLYEEKFKEV